jgi:hypothetical protein
MATEEQKVALKLQLLEFRAKREYGLCIKHKEDVLAWRILSAVVLVLTFGKVNMLEQFWATIGNVVYVPRRYDPEQKKTYRYGDLPFDDYKTLSHELCHVKWFYKLGFPSFKGGRAIGVVIFALLYIFPIFPVGLAYFRYRFEREAYLAGLLAAKRIGYEEYVKTHYQGPHEPLIDKAVRYCSTSPYYLWMWPFPRSVRRWFEAALLREEARAHSVLRSSQDE